MAKTLELQDDLNIAPLEAEDSLVRNSDTAEVPKEFKSELQQVSESINEENIIDDTIFELAGENEIDTLFRLYDKNKDRIISGNIEKELENGIVISNTADYKTHAYLVANSKNYIEGDSFQYSLNDVSLFLTQLNTLRGRVEQLNEQVDATVNIVNSFGGVLGGMNKSLADFLSSGDNTKKYSKSLNDFIENFYNFNTNIIQSCINAFLLSNNKIKLGTYDHFSYDIPSVSGGTGDGDGGTTNQNPPGDFLLEFPGEGSTGQPINLRFRWKPSTNVNNYKFYIAKDDSFSIGLRVEENIPKTRLNADITGLAYNTKYFWKVQAINSNGRKYSNIWSFTTTEEPTGLPGNFTLIFPINSATNVSRTPEFSWTPSSGAEKYYLRLSTSSNFKPEEIIDNIFDTKYKWDTSTIPPPPTSLLEKDTVYYWKVVAVNSKGNTDSPGNGKFTTNANPELDIPILKSPVGDVTVSSIIPEFIWSKVNNADSYILQISKTNQFEELNIIYNKSGIVGTEEIINTLTEIKYKLDSQLEYTKQYYWRVKATNNAGNSSYWSLVARFKTGISSKVTLIYPKNSDSPVSLPITFTWEAHPNAVKYKLYVSTDRNFTTEGFDDPYIRQEISTTEFTVSNLSYNKLHYWKVEAYNSPTSTTPIATSDIIDFTTREQDIDGNELSAFDLLTPINSAQKQPINDLNFSWQSSDNATSYQLQISTNTQFTEKVKDEDNITTLSKKISGLNYNTQYYWKVIAKNVSKNLQRQSTSIRSFKTKGSPPFNFTLISPINNNSPSIPLETLTFEWSYVTNASKYELIILNSQNVTDIKDTIIVSPTTDITSVKRKINPTDIDTSGIFEKGKSYYWTVIAINDSGRTPAPQVWKVNIASDTVVELTPPTNLSPDNQFDVSLTPTFTWNGSTGATHYQVEINYDGSITGGSVNLLETRLTSTNLENDDKLESNTLYKWRVKSIQKDNSGTIIKESAWVEASFTTKQESIEPPIEPPSIPTLVSPPNEDGNPIDLTVTPIVNFKWNSADRATTYALQVSTTPNFVSGFNVFNKSGLTNLNQDVSGLQHSTTYYWRVSAQNSVGSSSWSTVWKFVTKVIPNALSTPRLSSPINGADKQSITPLFKWNQDITTTDSSNLEYILEISTNSNLTSDIKGYRITSKQYSLQEPLSNGQKYYWRVKHKYVGTEDKASSWSEIWSFTTSPKDFTEFDSPTLLEPTNGSLVGITPTLIWSRVDGAVSYDILISSTENFISPRSISNINTVSYTIPSGFLQYKTRYYWKVRAKNSEGKYTEYSKPVFSFNTDSEIILPPGIPTLVAPENNSFNVKIPVIFAWTPFLETNSRNQATNYTLQVSLNGGVNFESGIVINQSNIPNNVYEVRGLSEENKYFWRVRSSNSGGVSAWTNAWTFETIKSPVSPTLVFPFLNESNINLTPTFKWNRVINATEYRISVSSDPNFFSSTFETNTLATSDVIQQFDMLKKLPTIKLIENTEYYWKVVSVNDFGVSSNPIIWKFRTISTPSKVELETPVDGAINIPLKPTLKWKPANNATSYDIKFSTSLNSLDSSQQYNVNTTSYTFTSNLQPNTQYYWKVRGVNSNGVGEWSIANKFITEAYTDSQLYPPTPSLPPNGVTDVETTVDFYWNPVQNADYYEVLVSTERTFDNIIGTNAGTDNKSNTFRLTNLSNNTTYYWMVRAKNNISTSSWSAIYSFSTIRVTVPPPPFLISPKNITLYTPSLLDYLIEFKWNHTIGEKGYYELQLSTADFDSRSTAYYKNINLDNQPITVVVSGITNPSDAGFMRPAYDNVNKNISFKVYLPSTMTQSSNYKWRVRSYFPDVSQYTEWSEPSLFQISKGRVI